MHPVIKSLISILIICIWQPANSQEYLPSFDMRVPYTPEWTIINNRPALYYELYITSFAHDTCRISKLTILNAADSSVVMQDDCTNRFSVIGKAAPDKENILAPGATAIIYIEVSTLSRSIGTQLLHRIEFVHLHKEQNTFIVNGALLKPLHNSPLVVGPPLNQGAWVAIYDPRWERGHRRMVYTMHGKARIPGRFAIDFIKIDQQGRYATGDEDIVKNWYGHGMQVLAVGDGRVAAIKNDVRESPTISKHIQPAAAQATGNYIALDMGNGHIAFYEHLQPGSITVQPGQLIKKGQPIAALGYTGQTTGPHLHFHIADGNSPLGAEGIPFAFDRFTLLGAYADLENFGKEKWEPIKNTDQPIKQKERPAPNTVIQFP
jgi:murein DD-endopeptidase